MKLLNVAGWHQIASQNSVNIGSGNGLLPDGNKPSTESMCSPQHKKAAEHIYMGVDDI